MILALALLQTLLFASLAVWLCQRAPRATPSLARLAVVAVTLLANLAVLLGYLRLLLGGASDTPGFHYLPGLVWGTQCARAAILVGALAFWFGTVRAELARTRDLLMVLGALALLGWSSGGAQLLGFGLLVVRFGRFRWIAEIHGGRRALALLVAAPLLLAMSAFPYTTLHAGGLRTMFAAVADPWPPALLSGDLPAALRSELLLARPLDRVVQALTDLFRAQLVVLIFKLMMMPVRLTGMSLKRRFMVNYLLVRGVPSVLSAVSLLAVAYLALGLHLAGVAREEFERTLTRGATVAAALADPGSAAAGEEAAAARRWLGADAERVIVTAGAGGSSPADSAFTGLVEEAGRLYLSARRADPQQSRWVQVRAPVDSLYLERLKKIVGTEMRVTIRPRIELGRASLRFGADSAWSTSSTSVRTTPQDAHQRFFLARSYLPAGEWWRTRGDRYAGAVELTLTTSAWQLGRGMIRSLGWLGSNLVPLFLILAVFALMGMAEGAAVRSGRSIVDAVLEEVASLRTAAARFGSGDLGHRLPIRGKDELSALAGTFNEMAQSLLRQREELASKERMEEELAVARSIQQRLLPQGAPQVPGLAVAGVSLPSREVGGDLYHYARFDDGRLGVAVGDVSGKSVPAALLMANVMSSLRGESLHGSAPGESLSRINRLIAEQVESGRFVTLFYGVIDPSRGEIRYACAGHNPPLLVSAAGGVRRLESGGVPLGVSPEASYEETVERLADGDVLVLYSDGVTEAESRRDAEPRREAGASGAAAPDDHAERELFGEERLIEVVRRLHGRPVGEIVNGVVDAVRGFAAGTEQVDDLTVVAVRRSV